MVVRWINETVSKEGDFWGIVIQGELVGFILVVLVTDPGLKTIHNLFLIEYWILLLYNTILRTNMSYSFVFKKVFAEVEQYEIFRLRKK